MVNPLEPLIAAQLRFWYQWLDTIQQMLCVLGVWGVPAETPVPAVVKTIVPQRGGCVGPADLRRSR